MAPTKKEPTPAQIKSTRNKLVTAFIKEIEIHEASVEKTELNVTSNVKQTNGFDNLLTAAQENIRSSAEKGNCTQISSLLRKGFSVDETDKQGNTALIYACQKNQFDAAALLIANGANVNHVSKVGGFTPLMFASWKGHVDLVTLLLKHEANVDVQTTSGGDTALHFAALCGFSMVVLLLRKAGAKTGVKNLAKKTPLDNAANYALEFDVAIKEKIPRERVDVDFTRSKSLFGLKQVASELSKYVDQR